MATRTCLKATLATSLFSLLLLFSTTAHAKTIYVDDDAPVDLKKLDIVVKMKPGGVAEQRYIKLCG